MRPIRKSNRLGKKFEEEAIGHLKEHGFKVRKVKSNKPYDFIAKKNVVPYFVEAKYNTAKFSLREVRFLLTVIEHGKNVILISKKKGRKAVYLVFGKKHFNMKKIHVC